MAIIKYKTVHGAAKEIGLTQTGVTQRIRALERQLKATLFTRSRRGMRPTQEGETLIRYCKRIEELEGEFLSSLLGNKQVRLSITGPSSLMRSRLIPATKQLVSRFPNILLTFNIDDRGAGLFDLKRGEADFAILARQEVPNELDSKLLRPEEYMLVAPYSWRNRPIVDIIRQEHIIDFNPQDQQTFDYLKKYRLFKLINKERHFVNNLDALTYLVIQGQGYTVLTFESIKPLVEQKELCLLNQGQSLKAEFALTWYPRPEMPKYFKEFTQLIH